MRLCNSWIANEKFLNIRRSDKTNSKAFNYIETADLKSNATQFNIRAKTDGNMFTIDYKVKVATIKKAVSGK